MIKNLIFDVGGVLFDYRWKEMFMDYGLDEDNAIRVGTQMFNDPDRTWDIFDLGIKSDEEIADIFCKKYPGDEDVIRWFICFFTMLSGVFNREVMCSIGL